VNEAPSTRIGAAPGAEALVQRTVTNLARWCVALTYTPRARLPRPSTSAFGVIALAASAVVASMFFLDSAASNWARHLPPRFTEAFAQITDFGLSGWFLYPLGFALLGLAAASSAALPRLAQGVLAALAVRCGFLFLAIALPGLFVTIVKRLIGRARPYVVVGGNGYDDPFAYMPLAWRPDYASMPSGHATTAAAAAIAIGVVWPRTRAVMWLYALTIMFSRVVVLAHHPSDVLAGALVGIIGALMVQRFFAARRLAFSTGLRPFSGPSSKRLKAVVRRIVVGR